jgi:hypothetical protein
MTWKAAANTLACLATTLGPTLSNSKASYTAALVTCRFDKVFFSGSSDMDYKLTIMLQVCYLHLVILHFVDGSVPLLTILKLVQSVDLMIKFM